MYEEKLYVTRYSRLDDVAQHQFTTSYWAPYFFFFFYQSRKYLAVLIQYRSCLIVRSLTAPQWRIRYSQVAAVRVDITKRSSLIVNHAQALYIAADNGRFFCFLSFSSSEQVEIIVLPSALLYRRSIAEFLHVPPVIHASCNSRHRCIFAKCPSG